MVNLRNASIGEFCRRVRENDTSFVCFGAGSQGMRLFANNPDAANRLMFFVDNDPKKHGAYIDVAGEKKRIISLAELGAIIQSKQKICILITSLYTAEILEQLDNFPACNGIDTYLLIFMEKIQATDFAFTEGIAIIPKKIHYCWFGKNKIPDEFQRYIDGWRELCPDYEIFRHDENNYDFSKNTYMKEAYQAQKWGFVPDYARMDIIYTHGGIYLDTDVQMIKRPDQLLCDRFFCAFQNMSEINFGCGFGAVKNHPLLKELLSVYDARHFIKPDGSFDLTVCTYYQEPVFKKYGFKLDGSYQNRKGIVIYPEQVLCARNLWSGEAAITDKTVAMHHCVSTWADNKLRMALEKLRENYQHYEERIACGNRRIN